MVTKIRYLVPQNEGWLDRVIRVCLGTLMLAVPLYQIMVQGQMVQMWHAILMLCSTYPILSGILGFDAVYNMLHIKSCDSSRRNQCGSFPYQIDAAMGHNPRPRDHVAHTLMNSRHQKAA